MTAECQRQAVEIERLRGKLEEASVGREVHVVNIIIAFAVIMIISVGRDVHVIIVIAFAFILIIILITRAPLCGESPGWRLV